MSQEVEKFDPSKLMDGVRDRIKATFVSLIPDAQWEQLVQKEVHDFFHKENFKVSYTESKSHFQAVCRAELVEISKARVQEILKTFQTEMWNCEMGAYEPTQLFKDLMIKHAPEIFGSVFSQMASQVIQNMKNRGY
jgi:hypothetical protein